MNRASLTIPFHRCHDNVTARLEYSPDCKEGYCFGCKKIISLTEAEGTAEIGNVIWTFPQIKRLVDQAPYEEE